MIQQDREHRSAARDNTPDKQHASLNNNIIVESEQRIGHYLLGKTLGKGTFGKVREATHTITHQKVAVKVLNKDRIEDDEDQQRLLRQMEILRRIRHPNIIQLYEIMQTSTDIYLMVEYAEKGQLFRLVIRQERIKQQPAGRIFLQIVNAVEYLHRLGISHRDLKPQNVLLDFDYNVKLIDFGLSNYYEEGKLLSTACGSPCYAPPQMVSGKSYNGFKTDVWSMGIILYVMVCGRLPFEDKTTRELYQKIISGNYAIPEYLSDDVKHALQSMLVTDPEKRISLSQIRSLPFFAKYTELQPPIYGLIVGKHPMPIDLDLLTDMKKFIKDLDTSQAQQDIRSNIHNHITTTYYLLQKQVLREGGKTNVDLQLYLQSSPEYQRDYGKAVNLGSNQKEEVSPEKKKRSVDSSSRYEKVNRSLLKRKKQQQVLKTVPNEALKSAQKISPTRKFRVGDYTYLCRDYARRLCRSTSKEQNQKFHSLRKVELSDKSKSKLRPKLNHSTISQKKLKKKQPNDNAVNVKIKGYTGDSEDLKETMHKTKETYLNKEKTSLLKPAIPLETKVWDAYFKNNFQPKIVLVNKNMKTSMKDRQKQEIIKQNIRQIKECFTKLPELSSELRTQRKQISKEKSASQIHTART